MRGFAPLFLLFIFIPLIELYVLIEVGGALGGISTILLCLGTAALGAWLVRSQGLSTLNRAQQSMAAGEVPAVEMFEGAFIAFAGILLLFPGLISDLIGFCLLIPPLRRMMVRRFVRPGAVRGRVRMTGASGAYRGGSARPQPNSGDDTVSGTRSSQTEFDPRSARPGADDRRPEVVDGDFERIEDDKK